MFTERGYWPVAFKQIAPGKYPEIVEMVGCGPDASKEMMIGVAVERIEKDEWKDYARKVLDRHLE